MPALPTPFDAGGNIDCVTFGSFCERQIRAGAVALVVGGTTGEAPTLTPGEHDVLVRVALDVADRRVPVIAGAGSNSTAHAIELARKAEKAGADAILSVVPYYNKPMQAGMYAYFRLILTSIGLPMILYDVPGRTVVGLADETIARLAELPQCIGLKDAGSDTTRPLRLRALVGSQFRLFSGDDATALAFLGQGGDGCISVVSNVASALCRDMHAAWRQGNVIRAQAHAALVARLAAVLVRESSPAPVKHALGVMHLMSPRLRLPLVEPKDETKLEIEKLLRQIGAKHPDYLIGDASWPAFSATRSSAPPRSKPRLVVVS